MFRRNMTNHGLRKKNYWKIYLTDRSQKKTDTTMLLSKRL